LPDSSLTGGESNRFTDPRTAFPAVCLAVKAPENTADERSNIIEVDVSGCAGSRRFSVITAKPFRPA